MTNLDSILKSRDITLLTKIHLVKAMVFPVVMYGCESWTTKKLSTELMLSNYAFGEDSWKSLGLQGDQISHKGNQSWIFIGSTDAEAEAPILWPPDVKSRLIRRGSDAGKDWRQEETGTTEDEVIGWHHWLNGQEFEQTPGGDEGQGGLVCCSPWGCKELDATEQLNNNNKYSNKIN